MSTNDVPGSNPKNNDVLSPLNWAEHKDGSLLLVYDVTNKDVVFSMFDLETNSEYKSSMLRAEFDRKFSVGDSLIENVIWEWHDKSPFPWHKILKRGKSELLASDRPMKTHSIVPTTAAKRVANAIDVEARRLDAETVKKSANGMFSKFSKWFRKDFP